jgi:hypothetical protein
LRIHEGDYAYDLEQKVDPSTMLRGEWRFKIYFTLPTDQVLAQGEAATQKAAEQQALKAIARIRAAHKRAEAAA